MKNIFIAGLGLIGGSFAKAIKHYTAHRVFAVDTNQSTVEQALFCGAVDFADTAVDQSKLSECEIIIVALNFDKTAEFVKANAKSIRKNAVVFDVSGVKRAVCSLLEDIAQQHGFVFVGGHPMAGKEQSGFMVSNFALFSGASMLLTPISDNSAAGAIKLQGFFTTLGFGQVKLTTPEQHDRVIAYTSQMAHIVSNGFIKSPTAAEHRGFSAGSFRDLTRVALIDEEMWTELFLANGDNLLSEIDFFIERITEYRKAIAEGDRERLKSLLYDGKQAKRSASDEESNSQRIDKV